MTDNHTPDGARQRLTARNYEDMPCRCRRTKGSVCDTCFSLQAFGAEVDQRIASGLVTGHSTEPLVFPMSYGAGLRVTRAALDRIKPDSTAATRSTEPPSLDEGALSGGQGIGAASKRD